ncbi:MAG: hypothetical protein NVS4B2_35290 [Chloroflexota bacterium]
MVPLVHGDWAEVRTVAVGTLDLTDTEVEAHAHDVHYFSRLCSAHDFIRQAALPLHMRGVAAAETVVAVMDGAQWLQEFIDAHCPEAVRILDFPHAVSYLARAAQAAFGPGTREASIWLDEWAPRLKTGTPGEVLAAIRALVMPTEEAEEVRVQVVGYLTKRRAQIAYAQFQKAGYPIGSGMVESANKVVVEARLKGSGMHWARANVTPMLALRGIVCSGQWETAWPQICLELRRQEAERRRHRREKRWANQQQEKRARTAAVLAAHPPSPTTTPTIVDGRPTDHHPWKARPYNPVLLERAKANPHVRT